MHGYFLPTATLSYVTRPHLLTKLLGLCVVVGEAEVEEEASTEVIPQRGAAFDRGQMARGWGYELGSHFYDVDNLYPEQ